MRVHKLGSRIGYLVAVVAFGLGAVAGAVNFDLDAPGSVVAEADSSLDSTEWN